jgi:TPR repeat protein
MDNIYRNFSNETLIEKEKEGHPYCTYLLGLRYLFGKKIEKNLDLAFVLLSKAVDLEVDDAYYDLGMCYKIGEGTNKNIIKAYSYFEKSEIIGKDYRSYYELGLVYSKGIYKNNKIYIGKDLDKAFNYFNLSYRKNKNSQNNSDNLYELGSCYKYGYGVEKNESKAFELFQKSFAMKETIGSQLELALCYKDGIGVEINEKKSMKMFYNLAREIQCECNCTNKQIVINNLISYYENKDNLSVKKLHNLGYYYYIDKNYKKSFEKYSIAASKDFAPSLYAMFWFYYKGIGGLPKNKSAALSLLYDSAEQGYKQAIIMSKQIANKKKESI